MVEKKRYPRRVNKELAGGAVLSAVRAIAIVREYYAEIVVGFLPLIGGFGFAASTVHTALNHVP